MPLPMSSKSKKLNKYLYEKQAFNFMKDFHNNYKGFKPLDVVANRYQDTIKISPLVQEVIYSPLAKRLNA